MSERVILTRMECDRCGHAVEWDGSELIGEHTAWTRISTLRDGKKDLCPVCTWWFNQWLLGPSEEDAK